MNDYWKQCCLLAFGDTRTGAGAVLQEEAMQRLMELLPDQQIRLKFIPRPDGTNGDEWPKAAITSDQTRLFIRNAFATAFTEGYRKVCGLFSIPQGFEKKHFEEAFLSIRPLDFCLGADSAGGIYLLGMSRPETELLDKICWEQDGNARATTREIGQLKKIMYKLPVLPPAN
jgi:hypothetical protein